MTLSETLFQEYCVLHRTPLRRLSPGGEKTADFEVTLTGLRVVVEVKEFTLNDDDRRAVRDLGLAGAAVWGHGPPGRRVRIKIEASKRQLERSAAGKCPAMLLLYDSRPVEVRKIFAYEVLVAMYGLETIDLHIPEDRGGPVLFGTRRFGKDRKLGPGRQTFISAVGVLRTKGDDGGLHLDIYDNVFAEHRLPLQCLATCEDMTVFTIPVGDGDQFREWTRVEADGKRTTG